MPAHGDASRRHSAYKRLGPAWAVGAVALFFLLMTVLTALSFWYRAGARVEEEVAEGGEFVTSALMAGIEVAEGRLVATAAFLRADEVVSGGEFLSFVDDVGLADGMTGIEYMVVLGEDQLEGFVETMQRPIPGYQVFELTPSGDRVPVSDRPVYYPVKWFEPAAAFGRAHGYDAGSDPDRFDALERAIDTEMMSATPFLRLLTEDDDDGFLLYQPVHDRRNSRVTGFTAAPIDLSELMAAHLPESVAESVTWQITDVTGMPAEAAEFADTWETTVAVGGRIWNVTVAAREGSSLTTDNWATIFALGTGLVLTVSSGLVAKLLFRRSESNRELEHLRDIAKSKDRFLASVSHELRTPLTGVLGFAELIRHNDPYVPYEERQQMLKAVADQALDLGNIIDDLLVGARAELDQLTVAKVPVFPRAQLAQVIEAYAPEVGARVKVIDELSTELRAVGDPGRVRQILRNLINNACRYGGPRIEVTIDTVDNVIRLDVADNGPPIPPDMQQRIFEPYQRAHPTGSQPDSVGIGLSIARTLARLMDGDVSYHRRDNWNVFELSLPLSSCLQTISGASSATHT
jgi:signal transduction histidine kinase